MSKAATSEFNAPAFQALTPGKCHQVAFTTGAAAQSLAFEERPPASQDDLSLPQTTLLQLWATQDCWIVLGDNPTAVAGGAAKTDSWMLRGGFYCFIGVVPGQKLSVIGATSNGTLDIVEGA